MELSGVRHLSKEESGRLQKQAEDNPNALSEPLIPWQGRKENPFF